GRALAGRRAAAFALPAGKQIAARNHFAARAGTHRPAGRSRKPVVLCRAAAAVCPSAVLVAPTGVATGGGAGGGSLGGVANRKRILCRGTGGFGQVHGQERHPSRWCGGSVFFPFALL